MSLFFTNFVMLDPDRHGSTFILPPGFRSAFRKTVGSRAANNKCGSIALIRIEQYYFYRTVLSDNIWMEPEPKC